MIIYIVSLTIPLVIIVVYKYLSSKRQKKSVVVEILGIKEIPMAPKLMPIQIYFGSQQGTASKFAKILQEEGENYGFMTQVVDLADARDGHEMVEGNVGIFCMATHGEGEPCDNAKAFNNWLTGNIGNEGLQRFKFTVFGLGNTQYEHYNKAGRTTNQMLQDRGAIRVYKYGEGDDNLSLEEDFNEWKQSLWQELKVILQDDIKAFQNGTCSTLDAPVPKVNRFNYTLENGDQPLDLNKCRIEEFNQDFDFQTKQFLKAQYFPIQSITELRQNNKDGSTLHIIIDIQNSGILYKTGQNVGIYPENDPAMVEEIAQYLNLDLDQSYICSPNDVQSKRKVKLPFPSPLTLRQILTSFCDFTGPVLKKTIRDLSLIALNQPIQQELERLSKPEGSELYIQKIEKQKKNIFQLLKQYRLKPTLIEFIELCPRISPRLFTVASSNIMYPHQVHLADSLLTDILQDGSIRKGLCSNYLERLKMNPTVIRVDFRESSFKLPEDLNTDIMMIGPGTGIAPFIGFLQEKEIKKSQGKYILYFGCRHQEGDFIFSDQITQFYQNKIIDKLYIAFSRDQESKVYVQDLILQNSTEVSDLLNSNGIIYICGSTDMGRIVTQTLYSIISSSRQISLEEGESIVKQMEKQKRIIKELW